MLLNHESLTEIAERCEKATPGPWWRPKAEEQEEDGSYFEYLAHEVRAPEFEQESFGQKHMVSNVICILGYTAGINHEDNAEFIKNVRTDVPALLGHVDALEAENAKLKEALKPFADYAEEIDGNDSSKRLPNMCLLCTAPQITIHGPTSTPNVGHLRAAREALEDR